MKKKTLTTILLVALAGIFIVVAAGSYYLIQYFQNLVSSPGYHNGYVYNQNLTKDDFIQFQSEAEYKSYLAQAEDRYYSSPLGLGSMRNDMVLEESLSDSAVVPKAGGDGLGAGADRYSETNIQVAGIDEPDIVKTNGQEIFYSQEPYYYYEPLIKAEEDYIDSFGGEYKTSEGLTHIINAFPPDKIEEYEGLAENGQLLLHENTLIIIGYDQITAYDVTEPTKTKEAWNIKIDSSSNIQDARLYNNKVYLITNTYNYDQVCPYKLLDYGDNELSIKCTDIYHPVQPISSDVNYSVIKINPENGNIENDITFVGTYDSTVYMSTNSVYVGYSMPGDYMNYIIGFIEENSGLFGGDVLAKIKKLQGYELSDNTKMMELEYILAQYINSLSEDNRLKLENDMENKMTDYSQKHSRELQYTQINKINVDNFNIDAVGSVPGQLLNQFSLDEYQDYLRLATTTGQTWWGFPFSSVGESVNDVYILNKNLEATGQVLDLGVGESIYSVRFLGEIGYVVTFKQIDPFYVIDLSNPSNPVKTGELKIPGYSSYLHPISDDIILGIGEEDNQVKVSLFNVSDPKNPTELDKYTLKEYWSDISETHHAFLLDDKHEVFFLPGSQGGYVFSYSNNKLELKKAVENIDARRAVYIDDYLYIISDTGIVILDENSWERVEDFDF